MRYLLPVMAIAVAMAGCSGRASPGAWLQPSGPVHLGDRITLQLGTHLQDPPLGNLLPAVQLHLARLTLTNRATGKSASPTLQSIGANLFGFTASTDTLPDLPSDPEAIGIFDASTVLDSGETDGHELDVIQDPDARLPGPQLVEAAPSTGWATGSPPSAPGAGLRPTTDYSYLASVAITVAGEWGLPDPNLASASTDAAGTSFPMQLPPATGYVKYTITGSFPKIADVSKGRVYRPTALVLVLSETDPTMAIKAYTVE